MRDIRFRGKNYENKWKYGDLVQEKWGQGKAIMIKKDKRAWSVLEDTVGQYTGLHDKNGKEIYEGDIISNGYEKCVVVWIKEQAGFMLKLLDKEYEKEEWTNPMIDIRKDDEVIGNIYDNPNLLEGE